MDIELERLRKAALISMEEKLQEQEEAEELAALREAALDSARERKLSSDPLWKKRQESVEGLRKKRQESVEGLRKRRQESVEGLGKRRLESPPSHHYERDSVQGRGYMSCSDSDNSGNLTPKMSANDSIKHTPPRCDPVFTVKVTDNMLLKRNNSCRSSSSSQSNDKEKASPPRTEDKITVKLRNARPSQSETEESANDQSPFPPKLDPPLKSPIPPKSPLPPKSPTPLKSLSVKASPIADVSPALSKVSSVEDLNEASPNKKHKKKHKKKKSSSRAKKPKQKLENLSSSEDEKITKKSDSNHEKIVKKENGTAARREKLKAAEARLEKLQSEFKQQVISENIISKIDKNIEMLQNAKKHKHDGKTVPSKKFISEISSNEEEELLKHEKKKSASSPRPSRKDGRKSKNNLTRRKSKSPSSPVDVSVSLKSKREFEQMKAELNKKATKPEKKNSSKSSPRKEAKWKVSNEAGNVNNSVSKVEEKSRKSADVSAKDAVKHGNGTKYTAISEKEEQELLGDTKNPTPLQPSTIPGNKQEQFTNVIREETSSDTDTSGKTNFNPDKRAVSDAKRKKGKKSKKKKSREEKTKKKKKRKKHDSDSEDSDGSEGHDKKKKVKIDKSELNKIVQFLKQRDEAQKSQDPKIPFNPKIINKETKPIEIKLKSKPKR